MAPVANSTKFQVELKGIKLPDDIVKEMDATIRRTVLNEVARLDLRGEYTVGKIPHKEWLGIWLDLSNTKLPPGRPGPPRPGPTLARSEAAMPAQEVPVMCPSGRCRDGALLLGIVQ